MALHNTRKVTLIKSVTYPFKGIKVSKSEALILELVKGALVGVQPLIEDNLAPPLCFLWALWYK